MGLSSAIYWWDEWKLRILVLCSLFVQFFLYFSAYVRNWYFLRRLRVMVWLAYIGGDALAIYALATLFNRQKQQQTAVDAGGGGSSALEVTWAPVLLIHLGGKMHITAYSLEDNELWKRHAITLVSQATVALYVFCKWWSGETRLLQAAVLLFIVGILKSGQKPWALRRASYGSMTSTYSSSRPPPPRAEEQSSPRWRRLGKLFTALCTCTNFSDIAAKIEEKPGGGVGGKGINCSLDKYLKRAQEHAKDGRKESDIAQLEKLKKDEALVLKDIYKLFLDLAAPYSVRFHYLQSSLNLDKGMIQHAVLSGWVILQFSAINTKVRSANTCLGLCTFFVLASLPLAPVILFAKSDKYGYDKSDITVTYILFFGTVVMELAPFYRCLLRLLLPRCNLRNKLRWQDMVAQHNIMSFCAWKKKPPNLMKLVATFSYLLRDYINKHWCIWHEPAAQRILVLVRRHAEDGWKEYIHDAAKYRRFNNLRGEYTLMKVNHHLLEQGKLGWTFNLPFDEYVLLWHLATDLCIHHPNVASYSEDHPIQSRANSVIISNYMIYLLFICPEMLIPGARHDLFIIACHDIEHAIKDQPLLSLDQTSIAQRVFSCMGQDGDELMKESDVISNAYKLVKALTGHLV